MKLFKWHLIDDIELRCYENGYIREFKKRLEILEKEDFLKTKRLTERDFEIERLNNIINEALEINKDLQEHLDKEFWIGRLELQEQILQGSDKE